MKLSKVFMSLVLLIVLLITFLVPISSFAANLNTSYEPAYKWDIGEMIASDGAGTTYTSLWESSSMYASRHTYIRGIGSTSGQWDISKSSNKIVWALDKDISSIDLYTYNYQTKPADYIFYNGGENKLTNIYTFELKLDLKAAAASWSTSNARSFALQTYTYKDTNGYTTDHKNGGYGTTFATIGADGVMTGTTEGSIDLKNLVTSESGVVTIYVTIDGRKPEGSSSWRHLNFYTTVKGLPGVCKTELKIGETVKSHFGAVRIARLNAWNSGTNFQIHLLGAALYNGDLVNEISVDSSTESGNLVIGDNTCTLSLSNRVADVRDLKLYGAKYNSNGELESVVVTEKVLQAQKSGQEIKANVVADSNTSYIKFMLWDNAGTPVKGFEPVVLTKSVD